MGTLTSLYRVPHRVAPVLIDHPEWIDALYDPECRSEGDPQPQDLGLPVGWEPPRYGFDKMWDDLLRIYRATGHAELYRRLDDSAVEVPHRGGAYIRYWGEDDTSRIGRLLHRFTSAELLAAAEALDDLTTERGDPFEPGVLPLYTRLHDRFTKWVGDAIANDELIFASSS